MSARVRDRCRHGPGLCYRNRLSALKGLITARQREARARRKTRAYTGFERVTGCHRWHLTSRPVQDDATAEAPLALSPA
jgi:hypothetical protein